MLPKIDPTIFNSRVRMIEFFVATLKSEVEKQTHNPSSAYSNTDDDFMVLENFNKLIREIVNTLKDMRVKESIVLEKNLLLKHCKQFKIRTISERKYLN
ncbi:hypothetical protein ACFQOY_09995 [Enterococcus alcedinis]|uniref:hypothetical protein n=1 Tax=Enterococcus alcedinis TaxID=1274384 RepID=UPI0036073910